MNFVWNEMLELKHIVIGTRWDRTSLSFESQQGCNVESKEAMCRVMGNCVDGKTLKLHTLRILLSVANVVKYGMECVHSHLKTNFNFAL